MQNKGSKLPKEHILVCLSSSPSNERIVRMAGKMAQAFSGSLTALYVQTPGDADMNAEDTEQQPEPYVRMDGDISIDELKETLSRFHSSHAHAKIVIYDSEQIPFPDNESDWTQ